MSAPEIKSKKQKPDVLPVAEKIERPQVIKKEIPAQTLKPKAVSVPAEAPKKITPAVAPPVTRAPQQQTPVQAAVEG